MYVIFVAWLAVMFLLGGGASMAAKKDGATRLGGVVLTVLGLFFLALALG